MAAKKVAETKKFNEWTKGGRGRPPVFQKKADERHALAVIKKNGITAAVDILDVSYPVLSKLAKKHGLTFKRGRKAVA